MLSYVLDEIVAAFVTVSVNFHRERDECVVLPAYRVVVNSPLDLCSSVRRSSYSTVLHTDNDVSCDGSSGVDRDIWSLSEPVVITVESWFDCDVESVRSNERSNCRLDHVMTLREREGRHSVA